MTTRNLRYLFNPGSIVVVGASDRADSVGRVAVDNLLDGQFPGKIALVNRRSLDIRGHRTYKDVADLTQPFDLAVLAVPPRAVASVLSRLGARGTRAAIVLGTHSMRRPPADSAAMAKAALNAARPHLMRILGPGSLGLISPWSELNAGVAPLRPPAGQLAFVAQSGANMTAVADWGMARGVGFSRLVSLGESADVDAGDMLDFLSTDPETRAILLHLNDLDNARKFMSAARAAARLKPLIVLKGGRFDAAPVPADSRLSALIQPDAVFDAALGRAGALRVHSLEAFFDAVQTLAYAPRLRGERLAILTNGYSVGLLAKDALIAAGGRLADLEPVAAALEKALPKGWWGSNPVDLPPGAGADQYRAALETLLSSAQVDAVAVLHCPSALTDSLSVARAVSELAIRHPHRILTNWLGGELVEPARHHFAERRVATFATPDQTVTAFMHLIEYQRNQEMLMETPPSIAAQFRPDVNRARRIIRSVLDAGREWLDQTESRDVLGAYGIDTLTTYFAHDASEVERYAREIGAPVAVKIVSPDILHKSEVGGVSLGLQTPVGAAVAADTMAERLHRQRPDARLTGFDVQPMFTRRGAIELVAGIGWDATFGPVVLFGEGGIALEVLDDVALALPPLNGHLAQELMRRTRVHRRLQGLPGRAPADWEAIVTTLIRIAQLAADMAEVTGLIINPLMADAQGVLALDARLRVRASTQTDGAARLAIRPYPSELEQPFDIGPDVHACLRPILPEDEPALMEIVRRLDSHERYMRFFASLSELSHPMAARLTQIDYDREMAWVLTDGKPPGEAAIFAVCRLVATPDNDRAEYAISVRGDFTGRGVGTRLMRIMIDYARSRGIGEIYGEVLAENRAMLSMCEKLGFARGRAEGDVGVVHVSKRID